MIKIWNRKAKTYPVNGYINFINNEFLEPVSFLANEILSPVFLFAFCRRIQAVAGEDGTAFNRVLLIRTAQSPIS